MIQRWLLAFVWTLALELPIYTLWLHRHLRRWTLCGLVLVVNAISHPLLWFVMPRIAPYWCYVLVGETGVVIVEALIIAAVLTRSLDITRALAIAFAASLTANLVSTVIGLLVMSIFA